MILRSYPHDFRHIHLRKTLGAFRYARPTGQRPEGIPEKTGTAFSDQRGQPMGMVLTICYSFSEFPTLVKRSRAVNQFVKMERQISVVMQRPNIRGHL